MEMRPGAVAAQSARALGGFVNIHINVFFCV